MIRHNDKNTIVLNDLCICCHGTRLGNSAMTFAMTKLNQLQEFCPSDSFIELDVKHDHANYGVQLVVRTPCNEISAVGNGHNLEEALEVSLGRVHSRLKKWRKERFACPTIYGTHLKTKGELL